MTEWNAGGYYRQSALQKWVADEHLAMEVELRREEIGQDHRAC
jgi:hypothetical protein